MDEESAPGQYSKRDSPSSALDGSPFRNTIEDILTRLFGHSWYHRGQIAQLVRGLGAEPAVTDFVYWSRQAL